MAGFERLTEDCLHESCTNSTNSTDELSVIVLICLRIMCVPCNFNVDARVFILKYGQDASDKTKFRGV